jgi:hypothetical protein
VTRKRHVLRFARRSGCSLSRRELLILFLLIVDHCRIARVHYFFDFRSNNDAHAYINDLIDIGVQNFVVRYIPDECINRANFLIVDDTNCYNCLQHI